MYATTKIAIMAKALKVLVVSYQAQLISCTDFMLKAYIAEMLNRTVELSAKVNSKDFELFLTVPELRVVLIALNTLIVQDGVRDKIKVERLVIEIVNSINLQEKNRLYLNKYKQLRHSINNQ